MISFDDAYKTAMEAARPIGTNVIDLRHLQGRVLAEKIRADMAMPPYTKAMVDGYACRRADLGGTLNVVETIPAGYIPQETLAEGQAAKIMTGAMVPDGADCVFMVEHSEASGDGTVRFKGEKTNDNIAEHGKDIEEGETLLRPGHLVRPPEIAVLAAMGYASVRVSKRVRVGVIATGDELVEPQKRPAPSQIRNSNAYQICAQVEAMHCLPTNIGIARDDEASLNENIQAAMKENDLLIMSGGVSMGEFDLVPKMLKQNGFKILFDRVAIQPGKPTTFAVSDTKFCFGLPGNPVSTYTIFELLVKPFMFKLMGHDYAPASVRMPLGEIFSRKSGTREAWVPVRLEGGALYRVGYHGSAHINALTDAQGMIAFPVGKTELAEGDEVFVRLMNT